MSGGRPSRRARGPRRALLAPLLALLAGCAGARYGAPDPAERDAVLAVVTRAFDAIAAQDPALWEDVLLEDGAFTSVRTVDGVRRVHVIPFAEDRARPPADAALLERLWDPIVLVDGDVATVFARYDFHVDGVLSHCGTDAITLLRTDAGWRIASVAWTVEHDCAPSPLGPIAPR